MEGLYLLVIGRGVAPVLPSVVKLDYRLFAAPLGYRTGSTMLSRCTHCHVILKAYGLLTLASYSLIGFGLVYVHTQMVHTCYATTR